MGWKKTLGGVLGILTAAITIGVMIATWNGAKFEWWQILLGIFGLLALAALAFGLWITEDN